MSPSSSTSSSDAARYLGVGLLTAVLLVLSVAGISLIGVGKGLVTWKEARLLSHQLDKIAAAPRVDVLFVGDSSLAASLTPRPGAVTRTARCSPFRLPDIMAMPAR
jgi:hypothetical protein